MHFVDDYDDDDYDYDDDDDDNDENSSILLQVWPKMRMETDLNIKHQ